jgi:transcriptional regulator with XRE-family HTH domain
VLSRPNSVEILHQLQTLHRIRRAAYHAGMNPLATLVRDARNRAGLTQEELSELIGRSLSYVGMLEIGRVDRPKPETLRRLAEALRMPIEDLLVATGQLQAPQEDVAATVMRIASLPTPEERLRAWRELPESFRASMLVLMRDVFQAAAQQLEELGG